MEYSPLALSGPPAGPRGFQLPPAAPPTTPALGPGSLGAIIERTAEVVAEETRAIGADLAFDLKASNARKSRCLYELSRAMKGVRDLEALGEHRAGLERLKSLLGLNQRAVRAHLEAVGEVAALLQGAIERAQSDGTYGADAWGGA